MRLGARLQLLALAIVAIGMIAVLAARDDLRWQSLVVPAMFAGAIALLLATLVAKHLAGDITNLRDITMLLSQGDLTARPPLTAPGEIGELATAVHRLSEHLGSRMAALKSEDALLAALIESLDEGVVAVDARRRVVRINGAARALLGVSHALPFAIDLLPRISELQRALDVALKGDAAEATEAVIGQSTVSLTARPLAMGGVVIAIFDLTRIRRLESVRRDFVANVSHELRTPLTVIRGFSETLEGDDLNPEMTKQFARTIHSHTERMQRIVDDLLDLSRLESGRWEPSTTNLDTREIAEEIAATFIDAASAKGLTIDLRLDPSASHLRADRTAVRQVLSNLADNAVRHTESGSVAIFSRSAGDGVWVGVTDTGPGIAKEHLPRIFERFYRVDSARGRHTGGTGLGLAIVKHLVDAHGGRLEATSEPGKGTTIAALFPHRQP
ncbi:MAG TPA: ATP-binding protein [Gemmatimonadaceae bacterium]|nr:ATP-binding protein [Gemmatimonadaceae bacterium]